MLRFMVNSLPGVLRSGHTEDPDFARAGPAAGRRRVPSGREIKRVIQRELGHESASGMLSPKIFSL